MLYELLWFLRGSTDLRYLHKNGVTKFWHQDVYKLFCKRFKANPNNLGAQPLSFEQWQAALDNDRIDPLTLFEMSDAGPIYGHQWRNFAGKVDQIKKLIDGILENPWSRYFVVSAWNPAEMDEMSLPACHMLWQCIIKPGIDGKPAKLDMALIQRSCDTVLGVPINIASYATLMYIICSIVNAAKQTKFIEPGKFIWNGMSCHIYEHHIPTLKQQLQLDSFAPCKLEVDDSDWVRYTGDNLDDVINSIKYEHFKFVGYESQPALYYELCTGLEPVQQANTNNK